MDVVSAAGPLAPGPSLAVKGSALVGPVFAIQLLVDLGPLVVGLWSWQRRRTIPPFREERQGHLSDRRRMCRILLLQINL